MTLPLSPVPTQFAPSPVTSGRRPPAGAPQAYGAFGLGAFEVHDDDVRVPLHGELDLATGPRLIAGLAPLTDPVRGTAPGADPEPARGPAAGVSGRGTVALEMSDLTFLDSSGLTALDAARTALITSGWRVCLTRPRPAVLRLLDLAIDAGWFPADTACADVELWGQRTPTRMTVAPWPELPAAGPDACAGPGVLIAAGPSRGTSAGSGASNGCGGPS